MSVMRHNAGQVEPMVRLAESLGAGSVKFNIVQPTARGETMHTDGSTLSIQELIDMGRWVEGELPDTTDLRLVFSLPHAFHPLSRIFGNGKQSGCGRCNIRGILGILGDGSYALCGYRGDNSRHGLWACRKGSPGGYLAEQCCFE